MAPKDKYTAFNRTSVGFRKGVHKVPKFTRVRCLGCASTQQDVADMSSLFAVDITGESKRVLISHFFLPYNLLYDHGSIDRDLRRIRNKDQVVFSLELAFDFIMQGLQGLKPCFVVEITGERQSAPPSHPVFIGYGYYYSSIQVASQVHCP